MYREVYGMTLDSVVSSVHKEVPALFSGEWGLGWAVPDRSSIVIDLLCRRVVSLTNVFYTEEVAIHHEH